MIKIKTIHIKRFRSIMDIRIEVDQETNFISICGENNSGKTNALRALNIFFNEDKYKPEKDAPFHKYEGTQGELVYPEITVSFLEENTVYKIQKTFGRETGECEISGDKDESKLDSKSCAAFLKKINFFFIESININYPELMGSAIDKVFEASYSKSRFAGAKAKLKEAYEEYTNGLLEILGELSDEINPLFQEYRSNWSVNFNFDKDVTKFRDLIADDIEFTINDSSNKFIDSKGSGLQRLAFILLHFKVIEKLKKNVILLIDEPDTFLHHGLQKKLLSNFNKISELSQIFITTHSPVFINTYGLKNVFLFELDITSQYYKRRKREFNVLKTGLVDLSSVNGDKKIKDYLGISYSDFDVLNNFNLFVEGRSDAVYIEQLLTLWGVEVPNIVVLGGADNLTRNLEFYNNFYHSTNTIPKINVLLDNDHKGRDVYEKVTKFIKSNKYQNIDVSLQLTPNSLGECNVKKEVNNEMEDLLYPELVVHLVNKILVKKKMTKVSSKNVCNLISQPAFNNTGILNLIEGKKNEANMELGHTVSILSENFKDGMARLFNLEGDSKLIDLVEENSKRHPAVKDFFIKLATPF